MARVSGRRDYSLLNNIGLANDKVHALARLDAILKRKLMKMSKLTMLIVAAVLLTSHARAQVTVEVAKITCHQFLAFSVADPKDIAIWLSGYYHGKHGASNFEPQTFKANFDKLKSACYLKENYNLPVMQVIEKTLGTSK
jgi:acid stress chaperone HdeB